MHSDSSIMAHSDGLNTGSHLPVPMQSPPEFPDKDRTISQEEQFSGTSLASRCSVWLLRDGKTISKSAVLTRMTEATTMEFVRSRTSIPIPKIYNAYRDKETGRVTILMERVEGENLDHAWDGLTGEEKDSILSQLKGYFAELRQIEGSYIGSVDGNACEDQHFDYDPGEYGPYEDEDEFTKGLVKAWSQGRGDYALIRILCEMALNVVKGHKVVMTHNDFEPRNILVRGGKVVPILDWVRAGFYPEYWEHCKALWQPRWGSGWLEDQAVNKVLTPYWKELAIFLHTSDIMW
ncbi:phosphotransferase enzyme family protein [Hypoxylon crocopeplum]|nr:phosphotransferase enzyme family protein [Hypoxylon crocopeplum]